MKRKLTLFISVLLVVAGVRAQTLYTNTYSQSVNLAVPDDNPNGLFSTLQANGVPGIIQSISVTLLLTNGYAGDYYCYLNAPSGSSAILLNRVGVGGSNPFGYSQTGFNVTFTDTAVNNIHFYQTGSYSVDPNGLLLGTWQADGRNIDPGSTPSAFDSASTTSGLNLVDGTNPNGTWTFFISDLSGGYQGTLVDWSLTIVTTPEPTSAQLLGAAGLVGAGVWLRRRFKSKRLTQ